MTSTTPQEPTADSPPVATALPGSVPGRKPLEDDTLNVVVAADGQKIAGIGAREAGNDTAGTRERKLLKRRSPLGVGPVNEEVAVEPE
jgi:hypothetical protein